MHRANLSQSKVILLRYVPMSAQTRMSNLYAAGKLKEDMAKSKGKMSIQTQLGVVGAMEIVGDPV